MDIEKFPIRNFLTILVILNDSMANKIGTFFFFSLFDLYASHIILKLIANVEL